MSAACSPYEWRAALDGCAERLLAEGGVVGPPVDVLALAATLGFTVAVDARQQGRGRCARLPGFETAGTTAAILLRPEPRVERRHWAVAHEIGEHHAHEVFECLGVSGDDVPLGGRERTADALANRLLLPTGWFGRDGDETGWDLARLKHRHRFASYELIARRMLEFDAPAVVTIVDHGQVGFRRSNLSGRLPAMSPTERTVWMRVSVTGRPGEARDRAYRVRAWPIHEPGWKREILRTEPCAGGETRPDPEG